MKNLEGKGGHGDGGQAKGASAISAARTATILFLAAVGFGFLRMEGITVALLMVAPLVGLIGVTRGVTALGQAAFSELPTSSGFVVRMLVALIINGFMAFGLGLAMMSSMMFSRGRQLRRFGKVLLPDMLANADWAELPVPAEVDGATAARLGAQWRENGRSEHASVAAFARLSLDLMALGAPPALIADCNRDALDEIRHAELCFSLARSLDGRAESPGPFPAAKGARTLPSFRPLALAALAVDSLIDGALHEGVSARVIARLSGTCEEPRIAAVLKEIAADEARHATHGWDVVAWCLAEGGRPVAAALRGALKGVPAEMHGDLPPEAEEGGWERFGIHGRALEAGEYARTRGALVSRLDHLLA